MQTSEPRLIVRPSGDLHSFIQLGPYAIESLILPQEEIRSTAYRVKVEPNSITSTSFHRIAEELYFVLSGDGVAVLDGVKHQLKAGVFLRLPPGTTHSFTAGPSGLEMLDIHTPGCRPDRDVYFVGSETPEGFKNLNE